MCRDLRVKHRYKQREVAVGVGVKPSTYGNIESSRWMVVGEEGAKRIADFYRLDSASRVSLLEAWARLALSPGGEKRREYYARLNQKRSKAKHHDRLKRSLCEVLGLLLPDYQQPVCACSFDREEACEVCMAFENLGLPPFTTMPKAIQDLAKLQDKLVPPAKIEEGA